MPIGVFNHSRDIWPVIFPSKFTGVCQVNHSGLSLQIEVCGDYALFSPLKLLNQLMHLVINMVLKFVKCLEQRLDNLSELSVD